MIRVMLRPKWLAMLVLVLAVAAGFAALAQWQIDSAIRSAQQAEQPALGPTTLGDAATPQEGLPDASIGRTVSFEGVLDVRDIDIISDRLQGDELGYWVIGHVYVTHDGEKPYEGAPLTEHAPGLAVAFGWAPTLDEAEAAAAALSEGAAAAGADGPGLLDSNSLDPIAYEGRLEYGQQPRVPSSDDPHSLEQMSPAYLVNRWAEPGPSNYGSYVILDLDDAERAGLSPITVVTAEQGGGLNWLNVFYAIEWVVFAFFALYVWWRLVHGEFDRERVEVFVHRNPDEQAEHEIRLEALRRYRASSAHDRPRPDA